MNVRFWLWTTGLLLATASACDCNGSPEVETPVKPTAVAEVETRDAGVTEDTPDFPHEAFGVPLPPELIRVKVGSASAVAFTRLKLSDVESFYKTRMVDYEHVEQDKNRSMFVGLHQYQADVELWMPGRTDGTTRVFVRPKTDIETAKIARARSKEVEKDPSSPSEGVKKVAPRTDYKKGDPITTRLPDGRLLAPGARWGEPYTPPKGSPLAHPRHRSNWGKPFGTWVLQ